MPSPHISEQSELSVTGISAVKCHYVTSAFAFVAVAAKDMGLDGPGDAVISLPWPHVRKANPVSSASW